MTKHRRKEAWVADILEAAAVEVDQEGYANLTMDGIAARAGLSKGGVYRFFRGKQALLVALLRHVHDQVVDFDVDTALGWQLPRSDTLARVFVDQPMANARLARRNHRIWLQLLSLSLFDDGVRREQRRLARAFEDKCIGLVQRLLDRDGHTLDGSVRQRVRGAVHMGMVLRDGGAVRNAGGASLRDVAQVGRLFIQVVGQHVAGQPDEDFQGGPE